MKFPLIDTHGHVGKFFTWAPELTVSDYLVFMDRHGIDRAVILPLVNPEEEEFSYTSEDAVRDCSAHPDRLIPFCNVDPRRGTSDGQFDFLPLLRHYRDLGCRGFGELLAALPTNDPRMKGLYRACGEVGFPVVFDFRYGTVGVIDPVGMPFLEECLREFPQTVFVGHGPGFWAEISAAVTLEDKEGYPRTPIVPWGSIDRLLADYDNLYADLSANSARTALSRDPERGREFVLRHHRKLMFGTDYFINNQTDAPMTGILEAMDLPSPAAYAVCRGTAERLLALA